jgi:glycosyltransferase involved in cell wall biosynthesis
VATNAKKAVTSRVKNYSYAECPESDRIHPVYNAEKYLKECLDSMLTQTFTDFELLLIDDGSTDGSAAMIAALPDPRIRYVKNEKNMGIARTRNRGLELARGEYIAFIDSDDVSVPQRLEKQVAFMDANRRWAFAAAGCRRFYPMAPHQGRTAPVPGG